MAAGAGLLDLLFGALVALGVEGVSPNWKTAHLLNVPWSHSLLMVVLLGGAYAVLFRGQGRGVMLVLFAAVFSHWALDILVHRPDMEPWPNSAVKLGFFDVFGPVSGWAEITIVVVFTAIYALRVRASDGYGRRWMAMSGLMVALLAIGFLGR